MLKGLNFEVVLERSAFFFFFQARLNFWKLNTEVTVLVPGLHVANTGWCQSSFISKSSSFEFCEIA